MTAQSWSVLWYADPLLVLLEIYAYCANFLVLSRDCPTQSDTVSIPFFRVHSHVFIGIFQHVEAMIFWCVSTSFSIQKKMLKKKKAIKIHEVWKKTSSGC